ncbi:MAG: WD40 repeat domain-containing protein [Planctomycetia bacterium]|nr:WD40 repeat domain-containing protein [Planctomycetia bacterium]
MALDGMVGRLIPLWLAACVTLLAFGSGGSAARAEEKPDSSLPRWAVQRLGQLGHDTPLQGVERLAVSPDGRLLATRCENQVVYVWDLPAGKRLYLIDAHRDRVLGLAFSPDSRTLATSSIGSDPAIRLWDAANGKAVRTIDGGASIVQFLPDGQRLLSADRGGMQVYDANSGGKIKSRHGGSTPLATSRSGELIAFWYPTSASSGGPSIDLRRTLTGLDRQRLRGLPAAPLAVAISPDDDRVAATTEREPVVHLWDLRHPGVHTTLPGLPGEGHTSIIQALAFSPDGRHLATASWDTTVRVWELASGRLIVTLAGHKDHVCALAYTADGRRLASGAVGQADSTTLVWDVVGAMFAPAGAVEMGVPVVKPDAAKLDAASLDRLWKNLADSDPRTAYAAIGTLIAVPKVAVPYLVSQIHGTPQAMAPEVLLKLIQQLDDDEFAVREAAQRRLLELRDELREPADRLLKQALERGLSPEARFRIEKILAAPLKKTQVNPVDALRGRRLVLALEMIGDEAARKQLTEFAGDAADAESARDATAALARLGRKI